MSNVTERLDAALTGRYRVDRQLGEGGMATVYLADDLRHERKVALKVLKPELAAVVGAERFLAEIKTTANLQHPHILALFDSGEADGFVFYVMPYVGGESLREKLDREHQLPVDEAVRVATSVAEALDYAHRHGVIHRDIKPANILLQDGKPVISDFGIALAVGAAGGGRLTETGLSLGTPHYMSPEQATGDQSVHSTTDIYALGCVLYEMLVGEPPYTGSTAQAILGKIIQAQPASATEARRSVPAHVDAAIRKALEKLAADRFSTAREFATALADPRFRHGEPEGVGAAAGRWSAVSVVVAAVLAGAVTGGVAWSVASDGTAESEAISRFSIDLPGGGVLGSMVQRIELTRDGRALVINALTGEETSAELFLGSLGERTASQLFLRSLESLEAVPIRGTENVGSFFLSPDGAAVGFFAFSDNTLKRVALAGGSPTTVSEPGLIAGGFQGATWGEGGRIVFATDVHAGLMQAREAGGAAQPLTTPVEGSGEVHRDPHFLPGGEYLLFAIATPNAARETWEIAVLSLATGEYERLTTGSYPQYVEEGYLVFQRGTALWAAVLDADRGTIAGDPVPVVEGVQGGGLRNFSVSPGGTLVYAPVADDAGAPRTLVWVDRDGQETALPIDRQPYVYPRISPDGDRLAVAVAEDVLAPGGDADLWVFDLDRLAPTRITFGGNNRFFPIWTPDGKWLTHADASTNTNRLLWSAADGVGGTDTLLPLGDRRFPTSWSPDGLTLAYYVGPGGTPTSSRDIWLLYMDGDGLRSEPLVVTPFQDRAPVFSPDGRWIAYVSDKSGREEVYVRPPYPGPGPESTVSTAGGREPVWSRDGTELFYRSEEQLMVVDVELGGGFRPGTPRPLFGDVYDRDTGGVGGIANYDVTADGERFVMVRRDASAQAELVVVLNWAEELRRLLSN
jgi:serine/threonine-protein kinase